MQNPSKGCKQISRRRGTMAINSKTKVAAVEESTRKCCSKGYAKNGDSQTAAP